jgi:hypothetical protein
MNVCVHERMSACMSVCVHACTVYECTVYEYVLRALYTVHYTPASEQLPKSSTVMPPPSAAPMLSGSVKPMFPCSCTDLVSSSL